MGDLIEVAELDSGKRELKLEPIRPIDALMNVRDRHVDEAGRKCIRVDVHAFADLARVKADRRALRSILDNLLGNALRYTPEDGEILLSAEEIKDSVQFTVRDTGRGIEAERLSGIFDRFNPMSESGTGLGLALVRRLVESLGGQIAVESRLGHGTTLPLHAARGHRRRRSASSRGGISDGRDRSRKTTGARQASHLHRRGARRGQDLPHAQRRAPDEASAGRRHRDRPCRNARPQGYRSAHSRPRDRFRSARFPIAASA